VWSRCLCLPLRYGVLVVGLLGCILNMAALAAYAILQVPGFRGKMGAVFSLGMDISMLHGGEEVRLTEDYRRTQLIYMMEITGVLAGMMLGLLVNVLLVIGVNNWKRWYLLHWLIYHLVLLLILFVVSVVFFSVEVRLRKLLGVVPVMASFFFIYCWSKVYELFCYISLLTAAPAPYCSVHHPAPVYCLPPPPDSEAEAEQVAGPGAGQGAGPGTEFYPVDPLSRGMLDRLVVLNRNMTSSTYVPFHNDDDYASQRSEAALTAQEGVNTSAKYQTNLTVEI